MATRRAAFQKPRFAPDFPYQDVFDDLWDIWRKHILGNQKKNKYYEAKNTLQDLGLSIPPPLKDVETVVGWPQKAVEALAVRSRFDGFEANDANAAEILERVSEQSGLKRKYRMAVTSELIYCFSAVTISRGDVESGEPEVIIGLHSAESSAARWDYRKNRIKYGFTIVDYTDKGKACEINLYVDDAIVNARATRSGIWEYSVAEHEMGRPLMEVLAYRPTEARPFGQSRITRAVRSITDSAVREALRTEVSAEFFTAPQKYLLGVSKEEAFAEVSKWEAYIGSIFTVGRDSEGDIPQFGQLSQGSMQPHVDYMRSLAARFAGETNVAISQLGVIHDNPSSAEAIYAANEPLIMEADDLNDGNGEALRNIARMVVAAVLDKPLDKLTEDERSITPIFRNPAMPSIVSQADAMVKIASVAPWIAETDVFLEQLGFDEGTRKRMLDQKTRAANAAAINAIFGGSSAPSDGEVSGDGSDTARVR
jgi:hypothetical protein